MAAAVSPPDVRARFDALRAVGTKTILTNPSPGTDAAPCYLIFDAERGEGERWTEHSYASAGVAYDLDPDPAARVR